MASQKKKEKRRKRSDEEDSPPPLEISKRHCNEHSIPVEQASMSSPIAPQPPCSPPQAAPLTLLTQQILYALHPNPASDTTCDLLDDNASLDACFQAILASIRALPGSPLQVSSTRATQPSGTNPKRLKVFSL